MAGWGLGWESRSEKGGEKRGCVFVGGEGGGKDEYQINKVQTTPRAKKKVPESNKNGIGGKAVKAEGQYYNFWNQRGSGGLAVCVVWFGFGEGKDVRGQKKTKRRGGKDSSLPWVKNQRKKAQLKRTPIPQRGSNSKTGVSLIPSDKGIW